MRIFNEVKPDLVFILSKINFKNLFKKFFTCLLFLVFLYLFLAMNIAVFAGMMLNNKQSINHCILLSYFLQIILLSVFETLSLEIV